DGNLLPGTPRVQTDVFLAAGKTYDVGIQPAQAGGNYTPATYAVYDRQLSLSTNNQRDGGMLAYLNVAGATAGAGTAASATTVVANPDSYFLVAGNTLTISDSSKGLIANDVGVYGVSLLAAPTGAGSTLTLNADGTFSYVPGASVTSDSFSYCANVAVVPGTPPACSGKSATVTLAACTGTCLGAAPNAAADAYTSNIATRLRVGSPGVLENDTDPSGLALTVDTTTVTPDAGLTVNVETDGSFSATVASAGTHSFTYRAKNAQGTQSGVATVTLTFMPASHVGLKVVDARNGGAIEDYRWIIEEDRTFWVEPRCQVNSTPRPAGCPPLPVQSLGYNFHTSNMPVIATGCVGKVSCEQGQTILATTAVACDVGDGVCRTDTDRKVPVTPDQVYLDPGKRYYISVLPGDGVNPVISGAGGSPDGSRQFNIATDCGDYDPTSVHWTPGGPDGGYPQGVYGCGHAMGGAQISGDQIALGASASLTVSLQPTPLPTAKVTVFVFEDDNPLNGENDAGGGVDILAPNEPGLGGFEVKLFDQAGGLGDNTGQITYDMFGQPVANALAGYKDPATGLDACPLTARTDGLIGMVPTCPTYESDGTTMSPLAGQVVIANLYPGLYEVQSYPAADRIARGEEWLQTNTLDGQKAHDAFARIGEPSYFQEFGPASYHVSIGFANPAIINARLASVCNGTNANVTATNCTNTLTGIVTGQRLSRTPDERLYNSGTHDAFYWTQCYVSVGDPDGIDFAFTKCAADGTFKLTGLPDGDWRITTFDQWNDQLVDGLSTPVRLNHAVDSGSGPGVVNMSIAATQWQTNLYTKTFIDDFKSGLAQAGETGIPFANVAVRLRDGSLENLQVTDFTGTANFNETFPLFSWYTVETDVTRYKNTGTHVVYDAGGPADQTLTTCGGTGTGTGYPPCGTSTIGKYLANTVEQVSLPTNLRVPGAIYCADADCIGKDMSGLSGSAVSDPPSVCSTDANGATTCSTKLSTGRIDPPWVGVEGWQGFPGQNSFLEFGKAPYYPGENGGIRGHVVYASTRPFDDPQMLVQTQWEPLVPHVTINLYQEGFAADGVTPTLTLVDHTQTTSFDDYAQGFRADGNPNMNCPGQGATATTAVSNGAIPDPFFFSLYNQPNYLDLYNSQHGGPAATALPYNSQFKCYDGMHNWNQLQPAPYDGMYAFPSVTGLDPTTGKPNGTNCKICTPNHAVPTTDMYYGLPMLPEGKYVVEVVVPPGFELVKEEDKNILIGDDFIAPVTQEFGALGNIFILPDQASIGSQYNANNAQNSTQNFGSVPRNGIVPGFVPEPSWPCVGEERIVPDYISLFPQTKQVAPFAGATRHLCDRKEVTLGDEMGAIAKFFIYTSTHEAAKFTGVITDDFTSEFDPFSPAFGEKFSPPNMP
ncbi:MAG: hypothetical protein KGJ52_08020, partial [Gammaproteobacteria bacterium]|nr:hypothetical protein [Gammaproteobacteria bacterium]